MAKDMKMNKKIIILKVPAIFALIMLVLTAGMAFPADAGTTMEELQRKIADMALLKQQLEDRRKEAESALEKLLSQQNDLIAEVHLLIRSLRINSLEDAQKNLRLRNDIELLRTISTYHQAFESKIRRYQTGSNKLTYLQQLAEDDIRMVATLNDFQIDALATQISLVISQYLDEAHSIQIDPQDIEAASAQSVWETVAHKD